MQPCRTRASQEGVSLVEVLVTLILSSVGFLGIAALQLASLSNGQEAYARAHASQMAAAMVERIRANRQGWLEGAYDDVRFNRTGMMGTRAGSDLEIWQREIDRTLPGGVDLAAGAVHRMPRSDMVAITIRWGTDRRDRKTNDVGATLLELRATP